MKISSLFEIFEIFSKIPSQKLNLWFKKKVRKKSPVYSATFIFSGKNEELSEKLIISYLFFEKFDLIQ